MNKNIQRRNQLFRAVFFLLLLAVLLRFLSATFIRNTVFFSKNDTQHIVKITTRFDAQQFEAGKKNNEWYGKPKNGLQVIKIEKKRMSAFFTTLRILNKDVIISKNKKNYSEFGIDDHYKVALTMKNDFFYIPGRGNTTYVINIGLPTPNKTGTYFAINDEGIVYQTPVDLTPLFLP